MGQFNELSYDVHQLLDAMSDSRVRKVVMIGGKVDTDREKGEVIGQLRRQLSTTCVRAAMSCLLDRMHQVGEGSGLAAKRREVNWKVEEAMKREREKHWLANARVYGGPIVRKGQFLRPNMT